MATSAATLKGATWTLSRSCKLNPLHFTTTLAGFPSTNLGKQMGMSMAATPFVNLNNIAKVCWKFSPSFSSYNQRFFSAPSQTEAVVAEDGPVPSPALSTDSTVSSSPSDPVKDAAGTLDIRVGCILKAWQHPEADSLYVEEVDVGEPEPRTICSGLVKYIPLDKLQGSKVVVLANLKPRNMRGVKSNGMLLAASDASHENVELLLPPEGSIVGERIWFGSEEEKETQSPAGKPNQIQKKKIWELVQPKLRTDESCVAALETHIMRTSAGAVVCTSLQNANIG